MSVHKLRLLRLGNISIVIVKEVTSQKISNGGSVLAQWQRQRNASYFFLYPAGHFGLMAVTFCVSLPLTQVIVLFFVKTVGFVLGVGDTLADSDGATFTNDLNGVLDKSNCPGNQIRHLRVVPGGKSAIVQGRTGCVEGQSLASSQPRALATNSHPALELFCNSANNPRE